MNIDGFALPIKQLKGTEPVESLDFSGKRLGPASAIVIASLIGANPSLTKILVGGNGLRNEGTTILCDALRESTVSKVEELSLINNQIGPDGAKAVSKFQYVVANPCQIRKSWPRWP